MLVHAVFLAHVFLEGRFPFIKEPTFKRNKEAPARNTAVTSTEFGLTKVFRKRFGSDFQRAATDPTSPVNPFFYSFAPFLTKIRKLQKHIKILLIFLIFTLRDGIGFGEVLQSVL